MAGSYVGGKRAAETNKKKFGADFYAKIGAIGGTKSRGGGFAADPGLARIAGKRGGKKSKRGQTMSEEEAEVHKKYWYYKNRLKHYREALKLAKTPNRKEDCKKGIEHYTELLKEVAKKM